ncbi:MAG TPA: 30S ribosomal protein S12 methylthiotransferase RimO [Firmicutes bacterium]|nr:30S ribosomal protein S12 methylthiotransferase RimO [Bacillota bacterium]
MVSLGCAKNLVDSEVMLGILKDRGFEIVPDEAGADVIIVNTCGFILPAKQESINEVLRLARLKQGGRLKALIMTGCLPQRYGEELAKELPEVDAFVGPGEITAIARVIRDVLQIYRTGQPGRPAGRRPVLISEPRFIYSHETPRIISTPPYTAYVKIAEGCDNRCSYCVIPSIRGRFRSRPIESIVSECMRLAGNGARELILVAQDTTRYGEDLYGTFKLASLLREISRIEGVVWVRFLYTYPTHITDELIEVVACEPKICKYFDIPLQHADDRVLRMMGRRNSREDALALINRIRTRIPDVTLRSTFIVGFPGETEDAFDSLLDFLEETKLDRVGVFAYSEEEGTPAEALPDKVPEDVKEERFRRAMELQRRISREKLEARVGSEEMVLVEGLSEESDLVVVARSQREAPGIDGLIYIGDATLKAGTFHQARITGASDHDLAAEIISPA